MISRQWLLIGLVAVLPVWLVGCPSQTPRSYTVEATVHDLRGEPVETLTVSPTVLTDIESAGPVRLTFRTDRYRGFVVKSVWAGYRFSHPDFATEDRVWVNLLDREEIKLDTTGEPKSTELAIVAMLVGSIGWELLEWQSQSQFIVTVPFGPAVSSAEIRVKFDFKTHFNRTVEGQEFVRTIVEPSQDPPPVDTVTVPDVTGRPEAEAVDTIEEAGLIVGQISRKCHDTVPAGRVISQSPTGGSTRPIGSVVNLVVSTGSCPPTTGTVPDVVGRPEAEAVNVIQAAEFLPGHITRVHSPTVPAGRVISQDPSAGSERPLGTQINLRVSLGPEEPPVDEPPVLTAPAKLEFTLDPVTGVKAASFQAVAKDAKPGNLTLEWVGSSQGWTIGSREVISDNQARFTVTKTLTKTDLEPASLQLRARNAANLVSSTVTVEVTAKVLPLEFTWRLKDPGSGESNDPVVVKVPLGGQRQFELAVTGGLEPYTVTILDYDAHGIQFKLWSDDGVHKALSEPINFKLWPEAYWLVVDSSDSGSELDWWLVNQPKSVQVIERIGATLAVDFLGPNARARVTKDYTAQTETPQSAFLFIRDEADQTANTEWTVTVHN